MTIFATALNTVLNDPHVRHRELDDPDTVSLTFPNGRVYTARPVTRLASEFAQLGAIVAQDYAKIMTVSVAEVPVRPPRDTLVEGYAEDYRVDSSEPDHFETSWRCNLSKVA
jgi:hypothetical protein